MPPLSQPRAPVSIITQGISSPVLGFLASAIFDRVDYNKNGVIEDVEVEVRFCCSVGRGGAWGRGRDSDAPSNTPS